MDHKKILKRAWEILKQYRVLWIFGLILALTTASPRGQSNYQVGSEDFQRDFSYQIPEGSTFQEGIKAFVQQLVEGRWMPPAGLIITLVIIFVVIGIALSIIGAIARYVSETSLIRMVDAYEDTGEKLRFRQGWKLGWSREAWKLFLIDLVINIPIVIVFIVLFAIAFAPLFLWTSGKTAAGVLGTVAFIGLLFLVVLFLIIVGTLVSLLKRFFRRVCVLEKAGVRDSIRQGWAMFKQNWQDIGLMWLITIGINIGWAIVVFIATLILVFVGGLLGGGLGLATRGLTGLVMGDTAAWLAAAVVGLPIFLLVIVIPSAFLESFKMVYLSGTWTLTYRELRALGQLEADALPEPEMVAPEPADSELEPPEEA